MPFVRHCTGLTLKAQHSRSISMNSIAKQKSTVSAQEGDLGGRGAEGGGGRGDVGLSQNKCTTSLSCSVMNEHSDSDKMNVHLKGKKGKLDQSGPRLPPGCSSVQGQGGR